MNGEMRCRVCGWWPPVTRVREKRAGPASDEWRWRQLKEHIATQALVEYEDGRPDGGHVQLEEQLDAARS